ncbi:MAG: hypothetical protein M1820_003615 [Bogoriella megaspora]|nr:MAG: hypothetical protein M1820_003615 [Bogoriella megaspora]
MGQIQVYCAICGAPIFETGNLRSDPKEWLTRSILFTVGYEHNKDSLEVAGFQESETPNTYSFCESKSSDQGAARVVVRLNARSRGTEFFDLVDSGKQVNALRVEPWPRLPGKELPAPLYLPIHQLCLELADHYVDSVTRSLHTEQNMTSGSIDSIMQLWEVLYRRLPGVVHSPMWILPEPHNYLGGQAARNAYWEPDSDLEHAQLHEQNPLDIPHLTDSILQNLQILASADGSTSSSANMDEQDWFREAITNNQIFPWLWDIDRKQILSKQSSGSGRWNWKLLARQLTQRDLHEPTSTILRLPLQLRNRRRIWRLLEEARVGDVAEVEEKVMIAREEGEKEAMKWCR